MIHIFLILTLFLLFCSISLNSKDIFAQEQQPQPQDNISKFTSDYSDHLVGLSIKFPTTWVYNENHNSLRQEDYTTAFIPSEIIDIDNITEFSVYVNIGKQRDLPFQNMPLDMYKEYAIDYQKNLGNNITKSEKIILVNGIEGYISNIDFMNGNKGFMVLFQQSPESYYLIYQATPDLYQKYILDVKEMLKTLMIIE